MDTLTLADYRKMADVTQKEMANAMEIPLRTYEDMEAGKVAFRPLHLTAVRWAMMRIAAARGDASFLPAGMLETVRVVAAVLPEQASA